MSETAFAELETSEGIALYPTERTPVENRSSSYGKKSQNACDISGLKKYLGNTDLDIDLDALRDRNAPR